MSVAETDDLLNFLFEGGDSGSFFHDPLTSQGGTLNPMTLEPSKGTTSDPFGGFTLDTPTLETLTDDFFSSFLSPYGDPTFATINPEQLLPTIPASSQDSTFQVPASESSSSLHDSSNSGPRSESESSFYDGSDLTMFPSHSPSHSPASPLDHTYAGSDESPHSPNSSVSSALDSTDLEGRTIFQPITEVYDQNMCDSGSESDDTDSNVEVVQEHFTPLFADGSAQEVYLIEDLAATEVVFTSGSGDDGGVVSIPHIKHKKSQSRKASSSVSSPFFVKIVPPPDVKPASPHLKVNTSPSPRATLSGRPSSRPAKRSYISIKNRHSEASHHSSATAEEPTRLHFNSEKRPHHYTRKTEKTDSKFPKLQLTEEEQRLLVQEGISLPERLPLTKQEERALKGVRRKIRNKQSALASRQKKKTYVDNLESRVKMCTDENQKLLHRVAQLENQNGSLLSQLKRLQAAMQNANKPVQASTCVMVLLLSFALLLFPNLTPLENNLPDEFKEILRGGEESTKTSLDRKPGILPGQSRNILGSADDQTVVDLEKVIATVKSSMNVVPFLSEKTPLKRRNMHSSIASLGNAGYIIDDDIDDDTGGGAKRRRVESVVDQSGANKTKLGIFEVDVKPDVGSLDLVIKNNAKNLGPKTYENTYDTRAPTRKLLTTETNILDM